MRLGERAGDEADHAEADVEEPSESNGLDDPSGFEALDPERKGESAPRADEVPRTLPEEDEDGSADDSGDGRGEEEEAFELDGRGFDSLEDAEPDDKDDACESEGVEADEENRRPMLAEKAKKKKKHKNAGTCSGVSPG